MDVGEERARLLGWNHDGTVVSGCRGVPGVGPRRAQSLGDEAFCNARPATTPLDNWHAKRTLQRLNEISDTRATEDDGFSAVRKRPPAFVGKSVEQMDRTALDLGDRLIDGADRTPMSEPEACNDCVRLRLRTRRHRDDCETMGEQCRRHERSLRHTDDRSAGGLGLPQALLCRRNRR